MELTCLGFLVLFKCMQTAAPAAAGFCQIAEPIRWSARDTRLTKEQADRHNRVGKRLCGWGRR